MFKGSAESILKKELEFSKIEPMRQVWSRKKYALKSPRQTFGLIMVVSGEMRYVFDSGSLTLKKGGIALLPKGAVYEVLFESETVQTILINFEASLDSENKTPQLLFENGEQFKRAFENILNSVAAHSSLLAQARFYRLFNDMFWQIAGRENKQDKILLKAKSLLEEDELSVEEIAAYCNMSQSTFRRKFGQSFNISPVQYRLDFRIERAKQLLSYSEMSLKEVCFTSGFYDEAYFYKVFRKKEGKTPLDFRKQTQNDVKKECF